MRTRPPHFFSDFDTSSLFSFECASLFPFKFPTPGGPRIRYPADQGKIPLPAFLPFSSQPALPTPNPADAHLKQDSFFFFKRLPKTIVPLQINPSPSGEKGSLALKLDALGRRPPPDSSVGELFSSRSLGPSTNPSPRTRFFEVVRLDLVILRLVPDVWLRPRCPVVVLRHK